MYKFDIDQKFDNKSNRVCSKITIIESDPGLPVKIIDVDGSCEDRITLWSDTWEDLESEEADFLRRLKLKIDRIREAKKRGTCCRKVSY